MKNIFLLLFNLLTLLSFSQNEKKYRDPFYLNIVMNSEQNYGMNVESSPYFLKDNILQLYPTEKLFIETEIKNDTIFSMKIVKENLYPEKTIEVDFKQHAEDRSKVSMFLIVKNPFDKNLIYTTLMYTPNSNDWKSTSILPVRPKLAGIEVWPHAIITLVLMDWKLD